MKLSKAVVGTAVSAFASITEAALASFCTENNQICFQWGAPQAAINSGSGNVYFQLRASTSYAWFALGTGSSMRGSSMFVVYNNGNNNVTLSTRRGQGHIMPGYNARSDVELLEGSGIIDGKMVANVRCAGCSDISISSSTNWISAWKQGSSLASTSPSQAISYHDGHSNFAVNLQRASIDSDSNPFISTASSGRGNGRSDDTTVTNGGGSNGDSDSRGAVVVQKGSNENQGRLTAHGILMAIVFVVGYPIGASLMPFIGRWMIHASWQFLAFLGMWVGFGLGYTVAHRNGVFFNDTHTRLGVFVVALMGIQPILGWVHHFQFLKTRSRGTVSYIHIWFGRAMMILGIVNGGLGLHAANQSTGLIAAYSVVAAMTGVIYIASIGLGISKRRRQPDRKRMELSSMSDIGRQG